LAIPESDLWVNLSPYEEERIIPQAFGETEMGRDLLAQDYLLKQLTAGLLHPEGEYGGKFWEKIKKRANEEYGTKEIPMDAFHKIWIMPAQAKIYEANGTAVVAESTLKVMLEKDYLAKERHNAIHGEMEKNSLQEVNEEFFREIILPAVEKEVNEGRHFAPLRQIYSAFVLATWYKTKMKQALLNQVYSDLELTEGVNHNDPQATRSIWEEYRDTFREGAFGLIKDEYDPITQDVISHQYFSGGAVLNEENFGYTPLTKVNFSVFINEAQLSWVSVNMAMNTKEDDPLINQGMTSSLLKAGIDQIYFHKGTFFFRSELVANLLNSSIFGDVTGVDLDSGQVHIYDLGVSTGESTINLAHRLKKRNNPQLTLKATELPKALAKDYIQWDQIKNPSVWANIVHASGRHGREIKEVTLVVNQLNQLSDVLLRVKGEEDFRQRTVSLVENGQDIPKSDGRERPGLDQIIELMTEEFSIPKSPDELAAWLEVDHSSADFKLVRDPVVSSLARVGVEVLATPMPDVKQNPGRNVLLLSYVLEHYPADLREMYWRELAASLNQGDIVVVSNFIHSPKPAEQLTLYQLNGDQLRSLGSIHVSTNRLVVSSIMGIGLDFDRDALLSRVVELASTKIMEKMRIFHSHFHYAFSPMSKYVSNAVQTGLSQFKQNDHD